MYEKTRLPTQFFYPIKPLIPRRLQIVLRRHVVSRRRKLCADIWPIDPYAGKAPDGWPGWPGEKKFSLILSHDVDTQRGHDRCHELMEMEETLGFRSCFNFVAERYRISEQLMTDIMSRGFDIGVHGLKHDGKLFSTQKVFKDRAARINRYLAE